MILFINIFSYFYCTPCTNLIYIVRSVAGLSELDSQCRAVTRSQRRRRRSSSIDRPTCNLTLTGDLTRWTVSTGPVLNRRSTSAGKYWIGPIQFLLDRAFSISEANICLWRHRKDRLEALPRSKMPQHGLLINEYWWWWWWLHFPSWNVRWLNSWKV